MCLSYLELNAFQEVKSVCIHFEIIQELRIWHIIRIIFWKWKVRVTRHFLAAVGNHRLVEAGSAFFNMFLYKQCMKMSVYAYVHIACTHMKWILIFRHLKHWLRLRWPRQFMCLTSYFLMGFGILHLTWKMMNIMIRITISSLCANKHRINLPV